MSNIVIPDGGNIGSASDPDAISIASSGKPTFSQGIANTGTIDAGTLGDNIIHSVGWQHIETKSCPTNVDSISFTNIFTDDYVAFDFEMAMEANTSNADFFIVFLDSSNSEISGSSQYFYTLRWFPSDTNDIQIGRNTGQSYARLVMDIQSGSDGGFRGRMTVRNVSAPTLAGVDTDRGAYRHDINFTGSAFIESKYSYITNHIRYNASRDEGTTMGIKIYIREHDNYSQAHNFKTGSWITCFGLKGKST
tara:strand:+ start:158 stop:907 length:750 start_codon:yes stop_codon:yes gene_type:complete